MPAPTASEAEIIQGSRLFLHEIDTHLGRRHDFAFETTLSGRGYLRLIERMRADGWRVVLIYLALLDVSVSEQRVAERVRYGGHDIPKTAIHRRFPRSLANLFNHYSRVCDQVSCYDNTSDEPILVFEQSGDAPNVYDDRLFDRLQNKGSGMTKESNLPSAEAQRGLEALRTAVRDALDRKRRLGQHAVIWRNGRVEILDWREKPAE